MITETSTSFVRQSEMIEKAIGMIKDDWETRSHKVRRKKCGYVQMV